MKRATLSLAGLLLIAGLYWLWKSSPPLPRLVSAEPSPKSTTVSVLSPAGQLPASTTTQACLALPHQLTIQLGMSREAFETALQSLGVAQTEEHWHNFVVQDGDTTLVWHLVKTEGASGIEQWALKSFRDDEDGPTLLSEKIFAKKTEALHHLKKTLPPEASEETTQTLHYPQGVSVKQQLADNIVTSFEVTSGQGRYSCQSGQCHCRSF